MPGDTEMAGGLSTASTQSTTTHPKLKLRSLRILHLLDHSVPLHSGYTFRTRNILREQHALGWKTVQLTTPKHNLDAPPIAGNVEDVDGFRFYRTELPGFDARSTLLRELTFGWSTTRRLTTVIRETEPDILHVHSPVVNVVPALIAAWRFGLPVVYEIRAFWEDAAVTHGAIREGSLRYRLTQRLETFVARRVNAVTTIAEGLREDLEIRGIPAHKITVIPNAVDIDHFPFQMAKDPSTARQLGLGSESVVGFVGSFYIYEGLDYLIRAVARLRQEKANIRLILVGGGPEEDALRALSTSLGVDHIVTFTGRVPHNEVARYYSVMDLLIYPRISSRLTELVTPLKPLEAMAQGKIVIASNVGGHRELIDDGQTGQLFEPGSVDAIVAAISEALENRDGWPKQAETARRFVTTERTWQRSVEKYRRVYENL